MQSADTNQTVLGKDFLFIIGSPRSGTTWLQLMIGAHPSVCATTELRLYDKYTAAWLSAWKEEAGLTEGGKHYVGLPVLWTETEFHGFLKGFLERVYTKVVAAKPQATHILDKHPRYAHFVEDIHFFIPQARFIHIIRDGRDVAVSLSAASRDIGWFPREQFQDYAMTWKSQVRAARKARAYADRYLELRYEELSGSPVPVLKAVFEFCGLTADDALVREIVEQHRFENLKRSRMTSATNIQVPEGHYRKGQVGGWKEELTSVQKYQVDRAAGDLLRELGYAQNGWWAAGPFQRIWVPLAAAMRNVYQRGARAGNLLFGTRADA